MASKLFDHTEISDYAIKLIIGQQPPFGSIHSLGLVELETLKAYIEINLANGFYRLFKLPAEAHILFDRKLDGSFQLCVNYKSFNNLTIRKWYLLPLVGELLDKLGKVRQFTQLNFTNAYH